MLNYAPILGITLSLLEDRVVTRCHLDKGFHLQKYLKTKLAELSNFPKLEENFELNEAVKSLQEAILHVLEVDSLLEEDDKIFEKFYSAGVWALNASKNRQGVVQVTEEGILEYFDTILLAFKIQVIASFFQFLEQRRFGLERAFPTEQLVDIPMDYIVDSLMQSDVVVAATKTLRVKGYTIARRGKRRNRKRSTLVGKITRINALPSQSSIILLKALAVDRIVECYKHQSTEASRYSKTFDTKDHPSLFQCIIDRSPNIFTAMVSETSASHLISRLSEYFDEAEQSTISEVEVIDTSGNIRGRIPVSDSKISVVTASPLFFLIAYTNGIVQIYDSDSLQLLHTLENEYSVTAILIDSYGSRVFLGDKGGRIFEYSSNDWGLIGELSNQIEDPTGVTSLASDERPTRSTFRPHFLISGHQDGSIHVWNILVAGSPFMFSLPEGHKQAVSSLAMSTSEIFSGGEDNVVKVWDIATRVCTKRLPLPFQVSGLSVDPDVLFTSCGNLLFVYDRTTYGRIHQLELPEDITSLTLDKNRQLYTASESLRKWSIEAVLDVLSVERNARRSTIREIRRSMFEELPTLTEARNDPAQLDISTILESPSLRNKFMGFLKECHAEENLLFWESVSQFKEFFQHGTSTKEAIQVLGSNIIETYIVENSDFSINVDSDLREKLLKCTEFNESTFKDAEQEVCRLLDSNFSYSFSLNVERFSTLQLGKAKLTLEDLES